MNYSLPVRAKLSLAELKPHLFSLPEQPGWIPYRTTYYKETWGFCLTHKQLCELEEGEYEVCIDASLQEGHLTYGEYYLRGETSDEVLISCHCCHPSLSNDNLSGIALATFLAKTLAEGPTKYSYRFVFIPGTIGSITWLSINETKVRNIKHGLVLTGVGDSGKCTYKKSRRGNAEIDQAMIHVLKHRPKEYNLIDFFPYGYDERQYCSPGFNLPVGCFMRTPHSQYPEYHTSADNMDFISPDSLGESYSQSREALMVLEHNSTYLNQNPFCEPQLGKRGLYGAIGGIKDSGVNEMAMLWVLNLSDGHHTLLDIAERSGLSFTKIKKAADLLVESALLREIETKTISQP
jgi:aminopeptidase-like protein